MCKIFSFINKNIFVKAYKGITVKTINKRNKKQAKTNYLMSYKLGQIFIKTLVEIILEVKLITEPLLHLCEMARITSNWSLI